jgi:hypothetical protein
MIVAPNAPAIALRGSDAPRFPVTLTSLPPLGHIARAILPSADEDRPNNVEYLHFVEG